MSAISTSDLTRDGVLDKKEILESLRADDGGALFQKADAVRKKFCGEEVHLRGIIEFSNVCKRNCLYCGLRKGNSRLRRYRMSEDEILDAARNANRFQVKTVVLQSGEDDAYPVDDVCRWVEKIKRETDCAVTLSIGEKSCDEYRRLREAGADRYLLKFETSHRGLYEKLKPDSSYDERRACLGWLRELGYQVGSGCMVGLPDQTNEILAEDIFLMKEFDFDMIGIGPFIAHPETPLCGISGGTLDRTLRVLALTRIATQDAHMPATTAIGSIHPQGRQMALRSGANVLMPNMTPQKYRAYYEIYPHKICINEKPEDCGGCTNNMVHSMGRTVALGHGNSLKKSRHTSCNI